VEEHNRQMIENLKVEIDHLRGENTRLKDVIRSRTEEANNTILKLAKMK
jgi:hypothetical protein